MSKLESKEFSVIHEMGMYSAAATTKVCNDVFCRVRITCGPAAGWQVEARTSRAHHGWKTPAFSFTNVDDASESLPNDGFKQLKRVQDKLLDALHTRMQSLPHFEQQSGNDQVDDSAHMLRSGSASSIRALAFGGVFVTLCLHFASGTKGTSLMR